MIHPKLGHAVLLLLGLVFSGCYQIYRSDEDAAGDASLPVDELCGESLDGFLVSSDVCPIQSSPLVQDIVTREGGPCYLDVYWSESRPSDDLFPQDVCDIAPITSTCLLEIAGIWDESEEGPEITEISLKGSWQSLPVCQATAKCALGEECTACGMASVFVPCG